MGVTDHLLTGVIRGSSKWTILTNLNSYSPLPKDPPCTIAPLPKRLFCLSRDFWCPTWLFYPEEMGGLSHLVGEIPQVLASSFGKNARAKGTWGHFGGHVCLIRKFKLAKVSQKCQAIDGVYQVWVDHAEVGWF